MVKLCYNINTVKQTFKQVKDRLRSALALTMICVPHIASAQTSPDLFVDAQNGSPYTGAMLAGCIILSVILVTTWRKILHHAAKKHEGIVASLPSLYAIAFTVICTTGLFVLSLRTVGGILPFTGVSGAVSSAAFFILMGIASVVAQFAWPKAKHFVFAFFIGTLVSFVLLGFYNTLFVPGVEQDPFVMALGIVCVALAWGFLFGPWRPHVKATVLGTFIFWLAIHIFFNEAPSERMARILATFIALIPAIIWCMLFLKEHKQRMSLVILMFFSGMLSTAPILFYDMMVRHQVELQFFLFKITPENFTRSSSAFVSGNLVGVTGVKSTLITTLISFLIVGFIEEVSKFWVLQKSGQQFFSSIDDVLQLGIIVAIGFAFAENVLNPSYFLSFVRTYLIIPEVPQWGGFMGNVLGRAILTNMVHILSTGVLAYYYGVSLFADAVIKEEHKEGKTHIIPHLLHHVFRLPEKSVFRYQMLLKGLISAVVLHGIFNFLVTLPDLLPGNPRTLGDIFSAAPDSFLHYIALLIIPSMFYVVGGFWILSILFYKKQCMVERGVLVKSDALVDSKTFYAQYAN